MAAGIRLTGTKEIAKKLKAMDANLRKKAVDPSLRAGIKEFVEEAKAQAPVKTGKLRDSIKARKDGRSSTRGSTMYIAGVVKAAFYWIFIEYGTSRISAKPFMRPAWEASNKRAIDKTIDTLRKKLKLK